MRPEVLAAVRQHFDEAVAAHYRDAARRVGGELALAGGEREEPGAGGRM